MHEDYPIDQEFCESGWLFIAYDSTLDDFISGCEDNKIPYWLYTYLNKDNEKAQAQFMVETCKNKVGRYFVGYILDVEAGNTAANVKSALDYLNGLGVKTTL